MCQKDQQAQQNHAPMIEMDITDEQYREYEWIDPATGNPVIYGIENAAKVYFYRGCTTHRVVDTDGVAHCVPAVGMYGCVLRWKSKPGCPAVKF